MADPLWDKAQLDPTVLAGKGGLRDAIIRAVSGYGDPSSIFARNAGVDPATGKPYQTIAEQYGIGTGDVSGAALNPYSTLHNLGDTLTSNRHDIAGGLAARGLENSGAMAASQAHESIAAGQRNYGAQQGLQGTLADVGSKYAGLIAGAYSTLMGQAANDPTIPAPPPAVPAPAPAPAAPAPAAQAPPNPYAQNGLGSPYVNPSLQQPAPQPIPKVRLAGVLAGQAGRGFTGHA